MGREPKDQGVAKVVEKDKPGVKQFKGEAATKEAAMELLTSMFNAFDWSFPACIEVTQKKKTLDYKAVFAIWMRHLAKSFTERDKSGTVYTDKQMHDLMCHQFLGYTPQRFVGKTVIKPALRTITYPQDLSRGEFFDFLRKVETWANGVGVVMPENPNTDYQTDKSRQEA